MELKPLLPGNGQVIVKMLFAGICRTQLMEVKGEKGFAHRPHLIGHEGCGVVKRLGPDVKNLNIGDRVIITWIDAVDPKPGMYYSDDNRQINAGPAACFAEEVIVSAGNCHRTLLAPNTAALYGCAIPTGAGAIINDLKPFKRVAIIGNGGVGRAAYWTALGMGVEPVVIPIGINRVTEKFDYVLECAGTRESMETAIEITSQKGHCVIAGNLPKGQRITLDPMELIQGKRITGTAGGQFKFFRDMPRIQDFNYSSMIHRYIDLEDLPSALAEIEKGIKGRILIRFDT